MLSLHQRALPGLPDGVARPGYDREAARVGIVHIGVGGFARSHLAWYVDRLLERGAREWGICGIGALPGDRAMADALAAQDRLYTLAVQHADGRVDDHVIGSLLDYVLAPREPERALAALCDPATRIVSLTITEGGYLLGPADFAAAESGPPRTAFGFLVEALRRRRAVGLPPFTVMSCDNLIGNGRAARAAVTGYAALISPELAIWIDREVAFPNSMVDRITPATTEADRAALQARRGFRDAWPVVAEPFAQWVLEDEFCAGRPPFEDVGVQLVPDVEPYEQLKLRVLNGAHQVLAYLGHLLGHRWVHDAGADPALAAVLRRYIRDEAAPTVPPVHGVDVDAYGAAVLERFANPYIRDTIARLAEFSSDRWPGFVLPVLQDNLANGGDIHVAALSLASWAEYLRRADPLVDNRSGHLRRAAEHEETFLDECGLLDAVAGDPRLRAAFARMARTIHRSGARAAIASLPVPECATATASPLG